SFCSPQRGLSSRCRGIHAAAAGIRDSMITRLRVQNFKCLLDTTIDFAPFTVLIGPNDSGKSSILDAIHLLGRTAQEQLNANQLHHDSLVWRRQSARVIAWKIEGTTHHGSFQYELSLSHDSIFQGENLSGDGGVAIDRSS